MKPLICLYTQCPASKSKFVSCCTHFVDSSAFASCVAWCKAFSPWPSTKHGTRPLPSLPALPKPAKKNAEPPMFIFLLFKPVWILYQWLFPVQTSKNNSFWNPMALWPQPPWENQNKKNGKQKWSKPEPMKQLWSLRIRYSSHVHHDITWKLKDHKLGMSQKVYKAWGTPVFGLFFLSPSFTYSFLKVPSFVAIWTLVWPEDLEHVKWSLHSCSASSTMDRPQEDSARVSQKIGRRPKSLARHPWANQIMKDK